MAILSAEEIWDRGGDADSQGASARWRTFRVFTDDLTTSEERVVAACRVTFGDRHPFDKRARCKKISPRQDRQHPYRWEVRFDFDRVQEERDPAENQDDPNKWRPRWRYGTVKYEETVEEDANGIPVVNAAGDPFVPPLVTERALLTFAVTIFRKGYDPDAAAAIVGKTNDARFVRWGAGQVKMDGAEGEEVYEGGLHYFAITYSGTVNPKGWIVKVMNRGFRQIVPATNTLPARHEVITDGKGRPVPAPVPLDLNGAKLDVGGKITFLSFTMAEAAKFPKI